MEEDKISTAGDTCDGGVLHSPISTCGAPPAVVYRRGDKHPTEDKVFWEYAPAGELRWSSRLKYEAYRATIVKLPGTWKKRNRAKCRASGKRCYYRHRLKRLADRREWAKRNPERIKFLARRHMRKYPERYAFHAAKRRATILKATDVSTSKLQIKVFYDAAARVSRCLGIKFHVDHIIPLSRGGRHQQSNLQLLPATLNHRKGNRI